MYNTLGKASNLIGHCPMDKSVDCKQCSHTFREARYLIRHLKTHSVDNANNARLIFMFLFLSFHFNMKRKAREDVSSLSGSRPYATGIYNPTTLMLSTNVCFQSFGVKKLVMMMMMICCTTKSQTNNNQT